MAPPTFRTIFVPLVLLSFFGHEQASQQSEVFNFELIDTSLEGQVNGPRPDEQHRLSDVAKEFRKRLAESGAYVPVDISEIADQVHRSNLQACGGMRYEIGATGRSGTRHYGRRSQDIQSDFEHEHLRTRLARRPFGVADGRQLSWEYRSILVLVACARLAGPETA